MRLALSDNLDNPIQREILTREMQGTTLELQENI
jgi:hypothetical protein